MFQLNFTPVIFLPSYGNKQVGSLLELSKALISLSRIREEKQRKGNRATALLFCIQVASLRFSSTFLGQRPSWLGYQIPLTYEQGLGGQGQHLFSRFVPFTQFLPGSDVMSFGGHPASGRIGQKDGNIPSIHLHVGLALGEGGNHWAIISLARSPSHNRPSLNYPFSVKFIPKPPRYQRPFYQGYILVACLLFSPFKLQAN